MNLLAHLLLSSPAPEFWLGNLMGDFVKGPLHSGLEEAFIAGITRHRAIDTFTDAHPVVRQSKRLFSSERRRFAGIILDVGYDYFLCRHWNCYSTLPLETFISLVQGELTAYLQRPETAVVPPACRYMIQRMIADDWLSSYQTLVGVGATLDRLSHRLKRRNALLGSVEEIVANEAALDVGFQRFFPELLDYVGQLPG